MQYSGVFVYVDVYMQLLMLTEYRACPPLKYGLLSKEGYPDCRISNIHLYTVYIHIYLYLFSQVQW